jgi:AcrR family transcriptional regulator
MRSVDNKTRRRILRTALKQFAHRGYAGASVQAIVDDARVTKPTLYYYFKNKAGLYQALLDSAYNERYRVMQEAASAATTLRGRLVEMLCALFAFLQKNSELMRLAFTTAFASPGEIPAEVKYQDKAQRNFDFVQQLIRDGAASGEISKRFAPEDLAMNFYGMMNIHVMGYLFNPETKLDRPKAESVVQLFFEGAAATQKHSR